MPNYVRKNGDVKYRKVGMQGDTEPAFIEFASQSETVTYTDAQVLEILREDGSTELYHAGALELVQYGTLGANKFLISEAVPIHRLWMRRSDGTGIPYKVPVNLPKEGGNVSVVVTSGVQNMELFGDKYFEMVYQLQRI